MPDTVITRDLPPLTLRAAFAPSSVNADKRTVDLTWSIGAKVLRGYFDRFWEELSLDPKHVRLDRLNSGRASLLNAHNSYDLGAVIGVVESARVDGKAGTARIRFAKAEDDPEADRIFRKVTDGIIANVSVGYRVYKFEKTENVDDKIPTYRAIDWEPLEVSLVPIGADAGAHVRTVEADRVDCQFITRDASPALLLLADADRARRLRLAEADLSLRSAR